MKELTSRKCCASPAAAVSAALDELTTYVRRRNRRASRSMRASSAPAFAIRARMIHAGAAQRLGRPKPIPARRD